MEKLIYKTKEIFTPKSFTFGHSELRLEALESDLVVKFLGVFYMELPRSLAGFEIWLLNEEERKKLLERRKSLNPSNTNFFKIISHDEVYYLVSLGVDVKNG
ncbi:hypothetical protein [Flavobacterium beibuense]|uniref:Uncharacterized protein n=1 Tax=Flavobacterium beibuense TaxID=657326 RepID=A0A444WDR0_9FLAO|nr:hypothetical protein [Flavobacterium beibuense]RYJ43990.1 hypothetical protein NU09_1498 [Flavobacterium beibuense]